MNRPEIAIAWEIWSRNRLRLTSMAVALIAAGAVNWGLARGTSWERPSITIGYLLLVGAMFITFGSFHFTEGQRKGGFGSFPMRMFTLPASTKWLVVWPMVYGAMMVIIVYVTAVALLLAPLRINVPILWPCLYLINGLAIFQTIVCHFLSAVISSCFY